ncbi:YqiA/YcfP family alpha/beta fold hydrolase [Ottowia sp.]|uniref:YqiA/YcfP family alpha/beta fold hydrolase n=1 Tax=Ottowia sp. TaxID=1898956 RepID=UPI003A87E978
MTTTHLLYLHGFRSSPQSSKAQQVAARVAADYPDVHWWCPQLPPSPKAAAALIDAGTADWPAAHMAVIGSSLGGFYATWLAQRRGCKAVVLNPAVDPARDLAQYIGEQTAWHDPSERFFFQPEYIDELHALTMGRPADPLPTTEHFFAVIAKGDELLDWREMHARYAGAQVRLLQGSDHALSDFDQVIDAVFSFLELKA